MSNIKLLPLNEPILDLKGGVVSGFLYDRGNLQHEYYGAMIEESKCAKERLCASGPYWPRDQNEEASHLVLATSLPAPETF